MTRLRLYDSSSRTVGHCLLFVHLRETTDPDVGRNQCIRLDEPDAFGKLSFDVLDKFASAHRHPFKQIADLDDCALGHWRGSP